MIWRWDQGRTTYFNFESIQRIASVLVKYNGKDMKNSDADFRTDLMATTGLPFAPSDYTVKRNYKRVFGCSMLATYANNRLIVTDIGNAIAANDPWLSTTDGYLTEISHRFRYPYPAFDNRGYEGASCFPFLAIQKLLFAKALRENNTEVEISLDDIGGFLIANDVTGLENLEFYQSIQKKSFDFESPHCKDQKRQVREMMVFIGQHSYLYYQDSTLSIVGLTLEQCEQVFNALIPYSTTALSTDPVDAFLSLTAYSHTEQTFVLPSIDEAENTLVEFTVKEGKKVFVHHLSRERNSSLRKVYIKHHPSPICDVCERDMHVIYPWTKYLLEIHHLLPLSSFDDETHTTELNDVVGLCPSCHRAIHFYYRSYLKENDKSDFSSPEEAREVYYTAKTEVQIT